MGFLDRKKGHTEPASVLSEEEIQKKLYGEFKKDPTRIAGGSERESVSQVSSTMPRPTVSETPPDLFEESPKPAQSEHPDFPSTVPTTESIEEVVEKIEMPRPVERKYQPVATSPVADPYQRYRELNKPKAQHSEMLPKVLAAVGEAWEFVKELFESNRFFSRQILYWTGGALVVFFLFWSVNALNTQREEAMQTNYKTQDKVESSDKKSAASSVREARPVTTKKVSVSSNSPLSKPKVPVAVAPVVPAQTQPAATWSYVIQVVTYPSADYAERIVTSLKQAGFDAFVKEDVRSTGTVFYVVMIGGFSTAVEAQQGLTKFRTDENARPFSDAFVKRTALD